MPDPNSASHLDSFLQPTGLFEPTVAERDLTYPASFTGDTTSQFDDTVDPWDSATAHELMQRVFEM